MCQKVWWQSVFGRTTVSGFSYRLQTVKVIHTLLSSSHRLITLFFLPASEGGTGLGSRARSCRTRGLRGELGPRAEQTGQCRVWRPNIGPEANTAAKLRHPQLVAFRSCESSRGRNVFCHCTSATVVVLPGDAGCERWIDGHFSTRMILDRFLLSFFRASC